MFLNNEEIMRREKLFPKEREISPGLERRESSVVDRRLFLFRAGVWDEWSMMGGGCLTSERCM